jgi:p38 MAP kinase
MKPFSTPVLSKRTYRELKLLKHLRHENVGISFHLEMTVHTMIGRVIVRAVRALSAGMNREVGMKQG